MTDFLLSADLVFPTLFAESETLSSPLSDGVSQFETCSNCGSENSFVTTMEGLTCATCGLVGEASFLVDAEDRRHFADSTVDLRQTERIHPDFGLATFISRAPAGRSTSTSSSHLSAISVANRKLSTYHEKRINTAKKNISDLCVQLSLPSLIERRAQALYADFDKSRTPGSRIHHTSLLVGLLYTACKLENYPRTFKELAALTGETPSAIQKSYRIISRTIDKHVPPTTPKHLVDRFCSSLSDQLPSGVILAAHNIATKAKELWEGKRPSSIAAAAILLAMNLQNLPCDEKALADTAGVSNSTIRSIYRMMTSRLSELVPSA